MTKKLISLLLCLAMVASLFVATVSAAGGETNVSFTVSKDTVEIGGTVEVVLSYKDMTVSSFACGFFFDKEKFECVSIVGIDPAYPDDFGISKASGRNTWVPAIVSNVTEANANGTVGAVVTGTSDVDYVADVILTATFKAKVAGTADFVLYEDTDGADGFKSDSIETKTVTITAPHVCEPADTKYESNGSSHWQLCSCGAKLNEGTCAGGSATCTAKAVCTVCGNTYGELAAHTYTAEVKKAEALVNAGAINCTTAAEYYYSCSVCGAVEGKADHTFKGDVDGTKHAGIAPVAGQAASCTVDGWKDYYKCACGVIFADAEGTTVIADLDAWKAGEGKIAAAHTYGELVEEVPAKHTKDELAAGMKAHYFCSACSKYFDETKTETTKDALVIAAPVHTFEGDWISVGKDGHTKACSCGLYDATVAHTPDIPAPTESQKQLCADCGEVLAQELGHQCGLHLTYVAPVDAWCEKEGNIEYYVCECGKFYTDAEAKNAVADVVIPALEHEIKMTALAADETNGTQHVEMCERCAKQFGTPEDHYSTGDNVATCTKVAVCDACKVTYGEKLDHNYDEYDVITKEGHAKACTYGCGTTTEVEAHVDDETGEFCSVCGFVYHTCGGKEMTLVKEDPATCTENGMKAYYICSCGKNYADADAKTEITDLESLIIPAAHTVVVVEGYEATCLTAGLTDASYCSACKEVYSVATVIPATGHDWTAWVTVKVEGETRYQERYCACGAKQENAITPEHKHSLVKVEAKAPTCTTEGNIEYWYCTGCDWMETTGGVATNRLAVILPITHDLQHVEAKAATCLELGNIEYWACKNCDRIEVAGGVLSNIKAVQLPTLDHTIEHVAAKAAACEAEGNVEYWYCTVCGYAWLDEARTLVTNLQSVKLGATHDLVHYEAKAATCLELGNIEYWACKNCDRIEVAGGVLSNIKAVMLPTLAHDIEHVAAKAPTATENGNIEYWYCKVCGYAWLDDLCTKNTNLKAVILPATGEPTAPSNPDTGDNAIYFVVALVAVATLGVAAVSFKKREN